MFPNLDAVLADPLVVGRALRAAVHRGSLLEMRCEELEGRVQQLQAPLHDTFRLVSDSHQRILASLTSAMRLANITQQSGSKGTSQPAAQAAASQPALPEPPNKHLVVDRVCFHRADVQFHLYRFWLVAEVNEEVPQSPVGGPYFLPEDILEFAGIAAETQESIKAQVKQVEITCL